MLWNELDLVETNFMQHSEKNQRSAESKSSSPALKIGSPNSTHEKEAESAAEKVARNGQVVGSESTKSGQISGNPNPNNGMIAPTGVKEQINSTKGLGDKLPDSVKRMMKGKSGELDDVRIHTDSNAAELSEAVNAKAFTYGKDIYFGQGKFDMYTSEGKELVAHELNHARQNNGWISRKEVDKNENENVLNITTFPWAGKINTRGAGFHKEGKVAQTESDYIRPDFNLNDAFTVQSKSAMNWLFGERLIDGKKQEGYVDWRNVNKIDSKESEGQIALDQLDLIRLIYKDLLSSEGGPPIVATTDLNEEDSDYLYTDLSGLSPAVSGLSSSELYVNVLHDQIKKTMGPKDAIAVASILAGAPLFAKRFRTPGSSVGSSAASLLLSKIPGSLPVRMPTLVGYGTDIRVAYTLSAGRFAARWLPYVGWALILWDLITVIVDSYKEYNSKTQTEPDSDLEFGGFGGGSFGGGGGGGKW